MLSAIRRSDGQTVLAYDERKENAPFVCPDCNELVALRAGPSRVNYFAHVNPFACEFAQGESEEHRQCKTEIYEALLKEPNVSDVVLERPCGTVRPDVSAIIKGVKVAIEVQISSLSIETIMKRTIAYHQKGIYVLWLLLWTPELDQKRYAPTQWEKWIHACYFGRIYCWTGGLNVAEYRFEPSVKMIPKKTWVDARGKRISVGGYAQQSVRFRRAERGKILNLVCDFGPRLRYWWEGGGITVPDAKIFIEKRMD